MEEKEWSFDVTDITSTWEARDGIRKDPSAVTLFKSGRVAANKASSERFLDLIGLATEALNIKLSVDLAKKIILIRKARMDEPGATPVRRSKNRKGVSTHFGAVFAKFPELRPATTLLCELAWAKDKDGNPCLAVPLATGLVKVSRKRGEKKATPSTDEKPTP